MPIPDIEVERADLAIGTDDRQHIGLPSGCVRVRVRARAWLRACRNALGHVHFGLGRAEARQLASDRPCGIAGNDILQTTHVPWMCLGAKIG